MLEKAGNVLTEANTLINGDRQAQYGHPKQNFQRIADVWSHILGMKVSPRQVALCMVGVKLMREVEGPKHDTVVDGAAYFALAEEVS